MSRRPRVRDVVRAVDGSWAYGLTAAAWCAVPVLAWATGTWSALVLAGVALAGFLALTYAVIRLAEWGA